ncbi:trans-sialidase, partial [Trypanosoma rangeli]
FLIYQTSELTFAVATPKRWVNIFDETAITSWMSKNAEGAAQGFHALFLFGVNEGIVATAAARYSGTGENRTLLLLSKISTDGDENWNDHTGSRVSTNEAGTSISDANAAKRFPLRVLAHVEGHTVKDGTETPKEFGFVTEIESSEGLNQGLQILPLARNFSIAYTVAGESLNGYLAFATTAIVTENDKRFVVPFQAIKANGRIVSTVIHSENHKVALTLHNGASAEGCRDPAIAPWEGGKLLMVTPCDDGYRRVYEFTEDGRTWTEALGTLSRVWGNSLSRTGSGVRGDVVTASIEEKQVMLFTHPMQHRTGVNGVTDLLHLWLTDTKKHIFDIGPISEVDKAAGVSSLLYTNGKLFSLYESGASAARSLVFTSLTEELARIKQVMKIWEEVDKRVSQLCSSSGGNAASSNESCHTNTLTAGLVGYLAGNLSGSQWKDEYLGVNATIAKGEKTSANGVRFKGAAAGAHWPVGKQGPNQLYHFANYNFTLLATVTIHTIPKSHHGVPLMGMKLNGHTSTGLVELLYDNNQSWKVVYKNTATKTQERSWEPDTTQYQLALMLRNGKAALYVDGQPLLTENNGVQRDTMGEISHLYIGGLGSGTEVGENANDRDVTVSNVLLYNRPLSSFELMGPLSKQNTVQFVLTDSAVHSDDKKVMEHKNTKKNAFEKIHTADGSVYDHLSSVLLQLLFGLWIFAVL